MARRIPPRACMGRPDISKKTVIASFQVGSGTREYLESLDDDQWMITSFEPLDRIVCFAVFSDSGETHNMTLTLPVISNSTRL